MKTIAGLPPEQASGLLAKAALSLSSDMFNDDADRAIVGRIIAEASQALEIAGELSVDEEVRLADYLDARAEDLVPSPASDEPLLRLSKMGRLPGDMYGIVFGENLFDLIDARLIETEFRHAVETIHRPLMEEHFSPAGSHPELTMISLFVRKFNDGGPHPFYTIVGAQREGLVLVVLQIWRLYPEMIAGFVGSSAFEFLKGFSERYGEEMEIRGRTGRLISSSRIEDPSDVRAINLRSGKVIGTRFGQETRDGNEAALIMLFNRSIYYSDLYRIGALEG